MAIHKLDIGDFDEIDYYLIAIRTSLENYRLAYFINNRLPINLSMSKDEVQVHSNGSCTQFSRFYFHDEENDVDWNLIQNTNEVFQQKSETAFDLFSDSLIEVATKVYLLPEFKKVDYFLKIENLDDTIDVEKIKQTLNTIEEVETAYAVEMNQIKSKNNLIF
ncbi:IPExxxVDY family protein [Flavobacterium algicola]|uniref:IPExxxVDY family protein n=1 Tax=Flavobacterium algicola TaxID=556529 RepID=UPI001EFDBEEC|nr:IPExxxVDY family protein [Flavobacterium algicola]MCG9792081.1 IPExxxVDY family protein [Flavobacterium algicola]